METINVCQSCSMPLDHDELLGTEKDGSKNHEYCKYCYKDGAFVNPGLSLQEMKEFMLSKMDSMKLPPDITEAAIARLPHLKRWTTHDINA